MKKLSILIFLGAFLLLVPTANAGTYPSTDGETPLKPHGTDCTLVTTPEEADSTHVYTLNPDHTVLLNQAYFKYWYRYARCDELQFHVDHSTPLSRLNSWLNGTALGWYQNIGSTHFEGQTVSTHSYEWFLIKDGAIHRIPDILTAWSWGLMLGDRLSIPHFHTTNFYNSVTLGVPLDFNEGQYADKIHSIWKDEDRDYSTLPDRLATKIEWFGQGNSQLETGGIFESCTLQWPGGAYVGNPYPRLLDWGWMQRNSGCALAP